MGQRTEALIQRVMSGQATQWDGDAIRRMAESYVAAQKVAARYSDFMAARDNGPEATLATWEQLERDLSALAWSHGHRTEENGQ